MHRYCCFAWVGCVVFAKDAPRVLHSPQYDVLIRSVHGTRPTERNSTDRPGSVPKEIVSQDMVVLALIERDQVEVGGCPRRNGRCALRSSTGATGRSGAWFIVTPTRWPTASACNRRPRSRADRLQANDDASPRWFGATPCRWTRVRPAHSVRSAGNSLRDIG